MKNLVDDRKKLSEEASYLMEHTKWWDKIPFINFPSDWEVRIVPPLHGAVIWFKVKKENVLLSIYLDCYDHLSCVGEPYWEVYPVEGNEERFLMNDIDGLLEAIGRGLENPENPFR